MPAPIPQPVRRQIVQLRRRGLIIEEIARRFDCSSRTVARLIVRSRQESSGIPAPRYDRTPHRRHPLPPVMRQRLIAMAEEHPTWGGPFLAMRLRCQHPELKWPSVRTIQRWLEGRRTEPERERRGHSRYVRALQPHGVWQMDATDHPCGPASRSVDCGSWMNAPERSCKREFPPLAHFNQVEPRRVQDELRHSFERWGKPGAIRVDNGSPWGSWSDWPTALAMWLIGLGIEMIWNDPCCPQQNGVVERSQGTAKRWAEPKSCRSTKELQERLDETDSLQRDRFPYQGDASRARVFPTLVHSGRRYTKAGEEKKWDLQPVLEHLSDYLVRRQVFPC